MLKAQLAAQHLQNKCVLERSKTHHSNTNTQSIQTQVLKCKWFAFHQNRNDSSDVIKTQQDEKCCKNEMQAVQAESQGE